jgi:uncharacterized membrane protein
VRAGEGVKGGLGCAGDVRTFVGTALITLLRGLCKTKKSRFSVVITFSAFKNWQTASFFP